MYCGKLILWPTGIDIDMIYSCEDQEYQVLRLNDARCLIACRHVLPGEGLYPRLNGGGYKYMPNLLESLLQDRSRLQFTRAGWIVVFSLIATLRETSENRHVLKPNGFANPKQKRNSHFCCMTPFFYLLIFYIPVSSILSWLVRKRTQKNVPCP